MSSDEKSPFWAAPPYILLTDVLQLDKVDPWQVNVGKLVGGFLNEMKRIGDIDFRISGNALYSASVIFMRKTRELVEYGILPPEVDEEEEQLAIPLIRPPFRLTNRRVTLQELLIAMDRVLSKGVRQRARPARRRYQGDTSPLQFELEASRAYVEESLAEVYGDLCVIMEIGEVVKFTDVLINRTRREIVRIFFALLHLYARSYVDIWMDDDAVILVKLLPLPEKAEADGTEVELHAEVRK